MARSSGGGSRSGGSRSGGSSSRSSSSRSHGGGGRSIRTSNTPFAGARRFRYRRHGRYHYVYSDTDLTKRPDSKPRWFLILFYLPFFSVIIGMLSSTFIFPEDPMSQSTTGIVAVYDDGNVFDAREEEQLEKTLNEFVETTGVVTQIVTVDWDEWQRKDFHFPNYALNSYYERFNDENCWLIVYSEKDNGLSDWEWEGIQGNNTFDVMDVFIDDFNQDVQSLLTQDNEPDPANAFMTAFDYATLTFANQTLRVDYENIGMSLFVTAFILFHSYVMIFAGTNMKYSNKDLEEVDWNDNPIIGNSYNNMNKPNISKNDVLSDYIGAIKTGDKEKLRDVVDKYGMANGTSTIPDAIDTNRRAGVNISFTRHQIKENSVGNDANTKAQTYDLADSSNIEQSTWSDYTPSNSDFDAILSSRTCHFCGKTYTKLNKDRCPHCNALLNY